MRGVRIHMEDGQRFSRWTVMSVKGPDALCICDCGNVKLVTKSNLKHGNSKSCGCLRVEVCTEKALRESPAQAKRGWEEGWWSRERMAELGRIQAIKHRGIEANGFNAKGIRHHAVKWFSVVSPSGQIVEGLNLTQLVRDNQELFDKADVVWKKNKYGTEDGCAATGGLRVLFSRPTKRKPPQSWKGWTANGREGGR